MISLTAFVLCDWRRKCVVLQISKAVASVDRKDLMRKLPKFIYDEDEALEVRTQPHVLLYSVSISL